MTTEMDDLPLGFPTYTAQPRLVLVSSVILLAVILLSTRAFGSKTVALPDLGNAAAEYYSDCQRLLREGYTKWSAFRMQTSKGSTVILSREHMVDFLKRPEEVPLEFELPTRFDFQAKYTGLVTYNPLIARLVREVMTPGAARFVPRMAAVVEKTIQAKLPQSTEWAEIKVMEPMMQLVAIAAGSVMVGPELCTRPEWIKTSIGFAHAVFRAAQKLKTYPWWIRPLAARFLPELKGVHQHEHLVSSMIQPVIEERQKMAQQPGWETKKPDDFLQWYLDDGSGTVNIQKTVLGIGLVSVNSTSNATVNALYDLAAFPEYQEPLRTEVQAALDKNNGVLTKSALDECHLLDSFLKESQRMSPEILVFGKRVLLSDFRLSDGTIIPKGSYVCCPLEAVLHDPNNYENPDTFDGYRHYRFRQKGGYAGEKHQWISSTSTALAFGMGRHSCPGRFFAAVEIKTIFAFLLLKYDVALPKGQERPKNVIITDFAMPNPNGAVLFRKRITA